MDKTIKSAYGDNGKEIKWTKRFKAGYILQREFVNNGTEKRHGIWMTIAYNNNGDYIGDSKRAYRLCKIKGIVPELRTPTSNTCSIGFNRSESKWYGWSHRAMCGFKIGDVVKKGDCCASSGWTQEYLKEHPEEDKSLPIGFKTTTLEDCKKMAIAFAESVS